MGNSTVELKTALYEFLVDGLLLRGFDIPVYEAGAVAAGAPMPRVVYDLGQSVEGLVDRNTALQYPLEIEVFDRSLAKDTTTVEDLTDAVDAVLNRQHILDDSFYVFFVRETRAGNLPVEDEYTFRRLLRYTAQTFA